LATVTARFEAVLTQLFTISRRPVASSAELDMTLGDYADVTANVKGLVGQVRVGDDMIASMPWQKVVWRVMMLPNEDLQQHDVITNEVSDEEWAVVSVPELCDFRGEDHHLEAIVEKREVI